MDLSPLQKARYAYKPKLPTVLRAGFSGIGLDVGAVALPSANSQDALKKIFPKTYGQARVQVTQGGKAFARAGAALRVGVILSGGPAPGGHNVIAGIFDGLQAINKSSVLIGFKAGPGGLVDNKTIEITGALVDEYRNTGGFSMIGSGRTKIETPEQFAAALKNAEANKLDAIVVVGGDDSNTNAALLAEYFLAQNSKIAVIGCPKTIDGDLKNEDIESSFGFDTACKIYAELVGNIERDAASGRKYWHFIKLMGRSASHIALEVALQTRPNVCLISEEIEEKKVSLGAIVDEIAHSVVAKAEKGENFGVVLIPEGIIEFVPEMKVLMSELNEVLAHHDAEYRAIGNADKQREFICAKLSVSCSTLYKSLPAGIQVQLTWDRDPHGNVQVSRIETEKLLAEMVKVKLDALTKSGAYKGKFDSQTHFFGYEGRCAAPTNFDADYCYSLGYTASALIAAGLTGYLSSVKNTVHSADKWTCGGVPLISMMNIERRHGADKPVIKKALVELNGAPFKAFVAQRAAWASSSDYRLPGPVQYFGPAEVTDEATMTLKYEMGILKA